ncbi:hypothetical protein L596_007019 [Steinernema carpocapsae]|uniref:Uncharacterized protein n=1 Tax=Steinernema carpocapsae TaxID=34508 RepID=A0A4V6A5U7_STECR|nr:hypothetical protein L596_007019 [Steinernema carpocapsae]
MFRRFLRTFSSPLHIFTYIAYPGSPSPSGSVGSRAEPAGSPSITAPNPQKRLQSIAKRSKPVAASLSLLAHTQKLEIYRSPSSRTLLFPAQAHRTRTTPLHTHARVQTRSAFLRF